MNPIILLGGGVVVLLLLIIGVVVSITSERSLVEERLGRFLEDERPEPEGEGGGSIITEWLNRRVARSSRGDRIARELARALRRDPIEGLQEVKVLVNGKIRSIYP